MACLSRIRRTPWLKSQYAHWSCQYCISDLADIEIMMFHAWSALSYQELCTNTGTFCIHFKPPDEEKEKTDLINRWIENVCDAIQYANTVDQLLSEYPDSVDGKIAFALYKMGELPLYKARQLMIDLHGYVSEFRYLGHFTPSESKVWVQALNYISDVYYNRPEVQVDTYGNSLVDNSEFDDDDATNHTVYPFRECDAYKKICKSCVFRNPNRIKIDGEPDTDVSNIKDESVEWECCICMDCITPKSINPKDIKDDAGTDIEKSKKCTLACGHVLCVECFVSHCIHSQFSLHACPTCPLCRARSNFCKVDGNVYSTQFYWASC